MKKILILFLSVSLWGCTEGFTDLNINPTAPVEVQPELLWRKVLYDHADNMSYEGFVAGNLLGQYFTAIDFNLFDRHGLTQPQYGGNPWGFLYENLRDTEILLSKSRSNPAFAVYEGPALIYKAFLTGQLTDLYGDVPYSQALQGKTGNVTPSYDMQRDIYLGANGILDNLQKGLATIAQYRGAVRMQGDILYNGDLTKWQKLGRSLQVKYLMRMSAKENVSTRLQQVLASGALITETGDDAQYAFTASQPNNFRMSTARIGDFNLFIMSETMEEILRSYQDPRMMVYFRPTANNAQIYRGLRNGPDASQLSISVGNYSFSGRIFREEAGRLKANFLTSFEVNFLLAEAALKGFIPGNAKNYYDKAVQQAFAFWGTALPTTYLTEGPAAFEASRGLQQIITQKWLGNIINGYEGWIEYRRTGFPVLKPVTASLNNQVIPVRMPYPTTEDALNNANFRVAADRTQNNSINAKVWWQP